MTEHLNGINLFSSLNQLEAITKTSSFGRCLCRQAGLLGKCMTPASYRHADDIMPRMKDESKDILEGCVFSRTIQN